MRCEYKDCDRKAYRKLLVAWLCKKHYLIVLGDLNSIRVGRPKEISMRRVFEFIESRRKFSTRDFCENFGVSYPTAQVYLRILAKHKILKNCGCGIWKIYKI